MDPKDFFQSAAKQNYQLSFGPGGKRLSDEMKNIIKDVEGFNKEFIASTIIKHFSAQNLNYLGTLAIIIPSKNAVMVLRNFEDVLQRMMALIRKECGDKTVISKLSSLKKSFEVKYPYVRDARDAVGHPEEFSKKESHAKVENLTIRDSIFNGNYATTFKGKLIEIDISVDSAIFLNNIATEIINTLESIATSD